MNTKRVFFVFFVIFFFSNLSGQSRYILHLNNKGEQEAIPLHKGEKAWDVISQHEAGAVPHQAAKLDVILDTLKNTTDTTFDSYDASVSFNHQEVAFQWFVPPTDGVVKEYHWRMLQSEDLHKGQLRAWNANPSLLNLPANVYDGIGNMGWYIKIGAGDYGVTPFKTDADSPRIFQPGVGPLPGIKFDPLGTETMGAPGGVEITFQDSTWNSYVLKSADTFNVYKNQPFGFTLQNKSPAGVSNGLMQILSQTASGPPYHSLKFYEQPRTGNADPGWWIRGFEWGVYVVVEYKNDRPPKIVKVTQLLTTLSSAARTVSATITDDNPGGGAAGVQLAQVFWKKGALGNYTNFSLTGVSGVFSGQIPGASVGDTIYYFYTATDVNNNTSILPVTPYSYTVFSPKHTTLALYNFRTAVPGISRELVVSVYMAGAGNYDIWDVAKYGIAEIPNLFASYNTIIEMTGDGSTGKNFTPYIGPWLATGTPSKPKLYFLSDQDHIWFSSSGDTTYVDDAAQAKYFGVRRLAPLDYPYPGTGPFVSWPWELQVDLAAAANDSVVSFIARYKKANNVKFYYHPYLEWGGLRGDNFYNWMDCIIPTPDAEVIFRDSTKIGNDSLRGRVVGVRKWATDKSWATVFLSFDILGTDFRGDTSIAPGADPKYAFILEVANPIAKFLQTPFATRVTTVGNEVPAQFSLQQNYPNPFNPTTLIQFSIAAREHVTLKIFNVLGQEIASLVDEELRPGDYSRRWDAPGFSSGVYFYRLSTRSFSQTRKLLLMK